MKPLKGTPSENDKYFIVKSYGGYSTCIQGNNANGLQPFPGSVLVNCVGAASGAFNKFADCPEFKWLGNTNAKNFVALAKKQGLEVGSVPRPGAVMCWSSSGAGHVAPVNDAISDTCVDTWESGWSYKTHVTENLRRYKGNGNWGQGSGYTFLGFIYNPNINPYHTPTVSVIKKGMKGDAVRWLQWVLVHEKCYVLNTKSQIDGSFGTNTEKALKKWQKLHSLSADGYCGPICQSVIRQKYTLEGVY